VIFGNDAVDARQIRECPAPGYSNRGCRRLGINTREYLEDVLTRLPGMLAKDAIRLTPANWLKARSGKPERMAA
jgi:hypothetical protein